MNQLSLPSDVTAQEVAREKSLGGAIALCARVAGYEPKQVMDAIRDPKTNKPVDKAQWSRWISGEEGVVWPKFVQLMDFCGNDAPLLWMNHDRGWDLNVMRRRETELEQRLRMVMEENRALRRVLQGAAT